MLLVEHDAKTCLSDRGLIVPDGVMVPADRPEPPPFPPPWVLKAQVPAGGRGKAGGISLISSDDDLATAANDIAGLTIGGFPVQALRVEQAIEAQAELYLGLILAPDTGEVIVMVSTEGGIEVENAQDAVRTRRAAATPEALHEALADLARDLPAQPGRAMAEAGAVLIDAFFALDATMIEVNPLFLLPGGEWVAGDLRLDLDLNALPRQPGLAALIEARPEIYADAAFKHRHGYDLVILDPAGEIGLVATGAGLSMQLIDEMARRELVPYNFCDIRSGMMRGDPTRLIENLRVLAKGADLRCVLVNIFAGITELGEFARLLLEALDAMPELTLPFVVRLVGNGEAEADAILRAANRPGLTLERDLDRALDLCAEAVHA